MIKILLKRAVPATQVKDLNHEGTKGTKEEISLCGVNRKEKTCHPFGI